MKRVSAVYVYHVGLQKHVEALSSGDTCNAFRTDVACNACNACNDRSENNRFRSS